MYEVKRPCITAMYFSGTLYFSFASASFFSTFCRITCSAAAPFTAAAAFSSSPTIIDGAAARVAVCCTAAARSCAADVESGALRKAPHATANMREAVSALRRPMAIGLALRSGCGRLGSSSR